VKPYVFLDRDGTLVEDPGYVHRVEDYRLLAGVADGLRRLADAGFRLAVVTNQSGIGRGYFAHADYERFQAHLVADLAAQGVAIDASFCCPHPPDAGCGCRKPAPGMLERARAELAANLGASFVIGDHAIDVELARRAGCAGAVLVTTSRYAGEAALVDPAVPRARDLREAADRILERARAAAEAGARAGR
jgi:histidinol-phosphate phosphatase family protein